MEKGVGLGVRTARVAERLKETPGEVEPWVLPTEVIMIIMLYIDSLCSTALSALP